jgi:hypothetical protein
LIPDAFVIGLQSAVGNLGAIVIPIQNPVGIRVHGLAARAATPVARPTWTVWVVVRQILASRGRIARIGRTRVAIKAHYRLANTLAFYTQIRVGARIAIIAGVILLK